MPKTIPKASILWVVARRPSPMRIDVMISPLQHWRREGVAHVMAAAPAHRPDGIWRRRGSKPAISTALSTPAGRFQLFEDKDREPGRGSCRSALEKGGRRPA